MQRTIIREPGPGAVFGPRDQSSRARGHYPLAKVVPVKLSRLAA